MLARAKTRSLVVERGLTRIDGDLARGTLIAFASDPKSTALDGPTGEHSPFTQAFLAHLFDPGVTIDTVMSRVRNDVWEKTGHHQLPWVNTSLIGEYELNPEPAPGPTVNNASLSAVPAESSAGPAARGGEPHVGVRASIQIWRPIIRPISPPSLAACSRKWRRTESPAWRARGRSTPTPAPQTLAMTEPTGPEG